MDEIRAIELLRLSLRCDPEEADDAYLFNYSGRTGGTLPLKIEKATIQALVEEINRKTIHFSLWLYDDTSMELLVREENPIPVRRFRGDELHIRDDDNGISYWVSEASDAYLLFFLNQIEQHSDIRNFFRPYTNSTMERRLFEQDITPSIFEFLRINSIRISTVRIKCDSKTSVARMSKFANSFLFQLAFNTDIALVPQRELDALSRSGRISRMRRNRLSEIDPPRRTYKEDLIHHYLLAISTDNPVVEYLSHYHVLEHFYEAVFNDDLILAIQSQITQPSFSYRKKQDIKGLISTIRRSLKIRNDNITFSEEEALRLTLAKFIEVPALVNDLESYDAKLMNYYRDKKVPFSGGAEVDLRSGEFEEILKKLAKRIYQTRNALVHSKDGEKAKYTPFADDHALTIELPLLRFISEQTILKDSSLIE